MKYWYAVLCIIIAIPLLVYAYAFTVSWSSPVNVVTTTPDIKVYWDSACTDPVTSIDFGNIQQGAWVTKRLYIKNEGGGQVNIYWNSTVSSVTAGKIQDWWGISSSRSSFGSTAYKINGTALASGEVRDTWYHILVDPQITLSSYSWTLNLGSWAA